LFRRYGHIVVNPASAAKVHPVPFVKGQHSRTHPGSEPSVTVVVLVGVPASVTMVPDEGPEAPPSGPEMETHGSGPSSKVLVAGEATRLTVPGGTHTVVVVVVPRGESLMAVVPLMVPEHHALKL
jgi:hypothetical protein